MGVLICDICGTDGKYKCPRCDTRSCSVKCSKQHKEISGCDGVRKKVTYVGKDKFTDLDLVQDFRILESATNAIDKFRRDETKKFTNQSCEGYVAPRISFKKRKLLTEAGRRGVHLKYLPDNFARRKENNTYYNNFTKTLYWDVEMYLVHLDKSVKLTKLADTTKLWKLLAPILEPTVDCHQLGFDASEVNLDQSERDIYLAMGYSGLKVYLRTETYKRRRRDEAIDEIEGDNLDDDSQNRYTELDLQRSLRHNLRGHALVEHPCLEIVSKWEACNYRDQIAVNIFNQTEHRVDNVEIEQEQQEVQQPEQEDKPEIGETENDYTQYYNFYLDYYQKKYTDSSSPTLPKASHVLNSQVDPYDSVINHQRNQQQRQPIPNFGDKKPDHNSKVNINQVNKDNAVNARKIAAEIKESITKSNNEDIAVVNSDNTNSLLGLVSYSDSDSE